MPASTLPPALRKADRWLLAIGAFATIGALTVLSIVLWALVTLFTA